MFEDDEHVLFICLHQDSNYPLGSGSMDEQGRGPGDGFTINIPFMPGCGSGAYRAAFDRSVAPALPAAPLCRLLPPGPDSVPSCDADVRPMFCWPKPHARRARAKAMAARLLDRHAQRQM